ncbi:GRIP1-associated protein 1-like [Hippocampus comes]|uniref:GRIP1-associated protein 1-like n=1 Tax=Hippocampus comes TaxID=109280 RepID=UPI00094F19C9|nr:PREDICTED: GRIP1-associated protein 1-like [Hippocampus comes]
MRANSEVMLQMSDVELTTSRFVGPAQNSGCVIQNTCDPEDPIPCTQPQHTASEVACESRGKTLQNEELKKSDANVKQLEETTVSLRATQDSLRRTLALEEKRTQGLLEDNAHLEDSLAALQSQFQTSECAVSDIGGTRHRARVGLDAERQIPEHAGREVACLQRERTNVSCAVQKKEKALAMLFKETDDPRAKMEGANGQHVHLIHAKDTPEANSAVCREERRACHSELATPEKKLEKRQVDLDPLRWQLKEAREELKGACLQAEEQKEMAAIFKHKYTAAMEKVHRVQGQVKHLAEELQYSQRQLSESQQATRVVAGELSELKRRHQDKVDQWESSQEALHQLTDELQICQNLLIESQQTVAHLRRLVRSLQGQVDALKRQRVVLECDLRLYRQSHSHANEDYLSLQGNERKLQGRCSEQAERLVECEKVILQMKSELERQNQEQGSPKQNLVTSCRAHLSRRGQWEQEVTRLKQELAHLERELADSPKKLKGPHRANPSLSTEVRQLSQELEALRRKHRTTVEVLAARSKEAKRMAACPTEEAQEQDDRR